MEYRGTEIKLFETSTVLVDDKGSQKYEVNRTDGLIFVASSKYGVSYTTNPETSLAGAKSLIDQALDQ